ncbi:hypothetical protein EMA8858_00672 [Emticicia aquatica]|jgi:hypothetical protein|uniref:Uncharacterized protein n=1 Tax=Emticicia aquatica TaxID=1681835 RepID=A0ABM9ALE6_9BACT|nr:hypothetical protein [Emticicia aquatica]CAH0994562.1 hypothetical protein EMA8858_00672 [Emticicia aquatica]
MKNSLLTFLFVFSQISTIYSQNSIQSLDNSIVSVQSNNGIEKPLKNISAIDSTQKESVSELNSDILPEFKLSHELYYFQFKKSYEVSLNLKKGAFIKRKIRVRRRFRFDSERLNLAEHKFRTFTC